jgi:2,3-bisphosphoglycerate-dependent phosphoglycerate mutase
MLFYFIRHGETDANLKQVLAGSGIDHSLNSTGQLQARALGQRIRSVIGQPVHRLLVSDMRRARETAEYLDLGLGPEIVADFREWHLGEWEGKPYSDFSHLLLGDGEPSGGETRKVFYSRVEAAWRLVHSANHPYVIVSHGAVWLALQDLLHISRFKIGNCALVRVWCSSGRWKAEVL